MMMMHSIATSSATSQLSEEPLNTNVSSHSICITPEEYAYGIYYKVDQNFAIKISHTLCGCTVPPFRKGGIVLYPALLPPRPLP